MVARNNAQIRKHRHDPEVAAADLQRALADPEIQKAFNTFQEAMADQIAEARPDGSPEFDNWEREMCRLMRTARRLQTGMSVIPQIQQLRDAGFAARPPTETDITNKSTEGQD